MTSIGQLVGYNIERIRKDNNLTQSQLSDLLREKDVHWSQSQISQLELGTRRAISFNALLILSIIFNVPLETWFQDNPEDEGFIILGKRTTPRVRPHHIRRMVNGGLKNESYR